MRPTPLEHAILAEYHRVFAGRAFPSVEQIDVVKRENSGAGRFVDLQATHLTTLEGRTCDIADLDMIEMEGVPDGLGWVLFLDHGKLDFLELFTFGGSWDGEERPWRLVVSAASGEKPLA